MGKVVAGITTSVDGYITGADDGPGVGLGRGGEQLHYWVFGGPWAYDSPARVDRDWLDETTGANGAVVAGRGTYEAAGTGGTTIPGSCSEPASVCSKGSPSRSTSSTSGCASRPSPPSSATG